MLFKLYEKTQAMEIFACLRYECVNRRSTSGVISFVGGQFTSGLVVFFPGIAEVSSDLDEISGIAEVPSGLGEITSGLGEITSGLGEITSGFLFV